MGEGENEMGESGAAGVGEVFLQTRSEDEM